MKLSAQLTFVMALLFAVLCLGYGVYGFVELAGMPPGTERDDARGFAAFWTFLGTIGAASAYASWRMMRDESR